MTRRAWAILGSAIFLVIAPGFVAGLVPFWITRWRMAPPLFGWELTRSLGGLLIDAGALGLLDSFYRFAVQGLGTPAPVAPPVHLVVTGLYRYVRNPMYVAVVSAILGQALFFNNVTVLWYGVLVGLAMHLFVVVYEEPALRRKFGPKYEAYKAQVRRWIPLLTPAPRSPHP